MRLAIITGAALIAASTAYAGSMNMTMGKSSGPLPTQSGQDAFGAIHEIVGMLEADPKTDWSKVNIDKLQAHLADMNNVTLHAKVEYSPIPNGEHIHVSSEDPAVRASIQRMVSMHVAMAGDTADYHMDAMQAPDGEHINVTAKSPAALVKIKALGFYGMLAEGNHHAMHHLMLASGKM